MPTFRAVFGDFHKKKYKILLTISNRSAPPVVPPVAPKKEVTKYSDKTEPPKVEER